MDRSSLYTQKPIRIHSIGISESELRRVRDNPADLKLSVVWQVRETARAARPA